MGSLMKIAFRTISDSQSLRQCCAAFIGQHAAPKIRLGVLPPNGDDTYEVALKCQPPQPAQKQVAAETPRWAPQCTCEACHRSSGGNISGDEFADPRAGRLGRRKGRRGVQPSRVMMEIDDCQCQMNR